MSINIFLKHENKAIKGSKLEILCHVCPNTLDMIINVKSDIKTILSLLLISSYDTQNTYTVFLNILWSQTK